MKPNPYESPKDKGEARRPQPIGRQIATALIVVALLVLLAVAALVCAGVLFPFGLRGHGD